MLEIEFHLEAEAEMLAAAVPARLTPGAE